MPFTRRITGYAALLGPGYMQSAMTLGGGTAFASIFAGAAFGYKLIWVAPLSMFLGVILLSAVAHQTLSTGRNPFEAMKQYAGGFFAWGWAVSAILSSIIWQFAQYALASSMLVLLADKAGWDAPRWLMGFVALSWCITVALLYGRNPRLVRVYEHILKWMVWLIIACFALVVIKQGIPAKADLMRGFLPSIPGENKGVLGVTLAVSGLSAAVGVNMLFVYPYSLLQRGWGREHRQLARWDLGLGMFIPYVIAASLMLIASASVFHYDSPELFTGRGITPATCADILASPDRLGPVVGLWTFGLGIIAMALSSITMQMLCSGFACGQIFGWKQGESRYTVGTLLPSIGVLGAVFWKEISLWLAVPTNIICGALMPLACVGFIILHRNRYYLGKDLPEGGRGMLWTGGMVLWTLVLTAGLATFTVKKVPGYIEEVKQLFTQVDNTVAEESETR